jgi:putative membrane protein
METAPPAATPPASGASPTSSLGAPAGTSAVPGNGVPGAVAAGPLNTADKTFLAKAAAGGLYEVEIAKLAVDKANDPAVKSFATMLVDHHSAANAELKALASMRDVKMPDAMAPDKEQRIAELGRKTGASFDQAFVKQVGIKDHEDNIKLFESASQDTKDAQLKAWVDKTLPTLKGHLSAAQKLPGASS